MLHAALRDLVFRRRRYLISTLGCGLVFAMSLVMTGLSDAFPAEWHFAIESLHADAFVTPEKSGGPFTGSSPFDADRLPSGTEPLVYSVQTALGDEPVTVALFGVNPGGSTEPSVASGRQLGGEADVLVSDRSPFVVGDEFDLAGTALEVVGIIEDLSVNGGMPSVILPIATARQILFRGLQLVTAGVVRGPPPDSVDTGLRIQSAVAAEADAIRLLASARQAIDFVKVLLWVVAALIIGSVTFLSVIERIRDFAVFKAIGTSTRDLGAAVMLQAVTLALVSSITGIAMGLLIAPSFPMPVVVSTTAMLLLPALGLAVGVVASLFGLMRVVRVEPALAFGSAT